MPRISPLTGFRLRLFRPPGVRTCPTCPGGTGCLVDFTDLPTRLTNGYDSGGVISNYMGPWYGLSFHSFYGIWGGSTAAGSIANVARLAAVAPSPGVIYTSDNFLSPSSIEKVAGLMQVSLFRDFNQVLGLNPACLPHCRAACGRAQEASGCCDLKQCLSKAHTRVHVHQS